MKKIYTLIGACLLTIGAANAQTTVPYFNTVNYIGAFPVTDNTTASDWTSGWAEFDPENATYPSTTTTVNANITSNTTWTAANVYHLIGNVAVTNGATLTIQAGTIIRGDVTSKSCLIITKGSKIIAQGTQADPIVFTSNEEPAGNGRASGDWGGLIILGNGVINTPGTNVSCTGCGTSPNVNMIEGFAAYDATQLYGGTDNADNSGVLSYVRIEFAGVALSGTANSEINGLTLGGVGSGTKLDHVQVSFSGDDAIEWFGGAVNAKHLIAYRTLDDDFDVDFGYQGNVQYGLIVRDPNLADASKVESFECDNFNAGIGRTPITTGTFSNITVVGPTRDGNTTPGSNLFLCAAQIRRNAGVSIFNSIFTGWPKGLQIAGSATQDNFQTTNVDSAAYFQNNWIIGATGKTVDVSASTSPQTFYDAIFGSGNNDSTKTNTNVNWVNAFPVALTSTPDFRLTAGSAAATAAAFTNAKLQVMVPVITSIEDAQQETNSISIYPNPANQSTSLTINLNEAAQANVSVYDVTGTLVLNAFSGQLKAGLNTLKINLDNLNSGVYFVALVSNNKTQTSKLVVAK